MLNTSRIIVMLCTVSVIMCASLPAETLTASIDEVQKKFSTATADKRINSGRKSSEFSENNKNESNDDDKMMPATATTTKISNDFESKAKEKNRNDKMLDYRYVAPSPYTMPYVPYYNPYYQQPYMSAFYSPYYSGSLIDSAMQNGDEYDEEYADATNDVDGIESDDGSRANKRRPGQTKNSPIFYIRLPPTPYMFVPGMGYISQPPTIQPLTPQYPINPFINLPITYLSNAKPTGVFPWNQQPTNNFGTPQFPSYLPQRPQKPYRPKPQVGVTPSQGPDSKITHLGSYLFNGRPENIYLMPPYHNPYASPYQYQPNPYQPNPYQPNPYQAAPIPPTPYNPYTPLYAPPPALPQYY